MGYQPSYDYSEETIKRYTKDNVAIAPNNYIYISHLDEGYQYWRLPNWPDSFSDSMQSSFQPTQALGRSAPVYTYSNSGPRIINITLDIHRDEFDDVNMSWSNAKLGYGEDYVDNLVRALQSIALPKYNANNKAVEPPLVALKIGKSLFIKGIVNGAVGVTQEKPILVGDKYASYKISFTITEVDPYDSTTVFTNGSFRGEVNTFRQGAKNYIGIDD